MYTRASGMPSAARVITRTSAGAKQNDNETGPAQISSSHTGRAPRGPRRGDVAVSQAIWTRRRLGPPHQRDGGGLDRPDQPSFSKQVGADRRHLRDLGIVPAGVDPSASAEQ